MGKWTALVGFMWLFGCGASKNAGVDAAVLADLAQETCSIALSGAVSGSFACSGTAIYESGKNVSMVELSALGPTVTLGVGSRAMLAAGTFLDTDASAIGNCFVQSMSGSMVQQWEAEAGGPAPHDGSYKMVLTSVMVTSSGGGDVNYAVHGTIDAMLVPVGTSAATGTVTASASF